MKKTVAVILSALLIMTVFAGCGSKEKADDKGTLYVYCFGDYFDPQLQYQFEEQTGYKVVIDLFDTNEEMYPIIEKGSANYDIVCASDYMIEKLAQNGLLAEINFDNIPNIENLADNIKPFVEEFDPGMKYSVPHTWGTYGIMYNKTMVDDPVDSWDILWNEKYSGKIVMPNSMREGYMIAAEKLGYSINTTSEDELKKMTDLLIQQKPLVYSFANDSARETMIGDSAAMAVITSGEVIYSKEYNENLEFAIPKEGTEVWTDCWAIPKNCANREAAEAWINFMLDGDVAAANFEYLTYAIPNSLIADMVDEPVLDPPAEILEKCETLKNLGQEADDMYSRYWKTYKAD